jgi:hypothetical protein
MSFPIRASRTIGRARHRFSLLAPLYAALFAGCVDDAIAPHVPAPPTDVTPLFWYLRNDHRAVTLSTVAPYDTLRIRAVPHDGAGRPMSLEGELTYRSSQPARVEVSADGLIRAVTAGTNVYVISTFAAANLRHVDTTVVNVTTRASPAPVARFSVQPVPPDSTHWAIHHDVLASLPGYQKRPPLRVDDASGAPITGVAVRYTSSDPRLVPIHSFNGEIKSRRLGRATFTAEATIYGTTWRDSLELDFDWPPMGWVSMWNAAGQGAEPRIEPWPAIVRIKKGGTVVFSNDMPTTVGVVFDDPAQVVERTSLGCPSMVDPGGNGNIEPFNDSPYKGFQNCRSRRFPVTGVYTFRLTPSGATGKVIVEESAL